MFILENMFISNLSKKKIKPWRYMCTLLSVDIFFVIINVHWFYSPYPWKPAWLTLIIQPDLVKKDLIYLYNVFKGALYHEGFCPPFLDWGFQPIDFGVKTFRLQGKLYNFVVMDSKSKMEVWAVCGISFFFCMYFSIALTFHLKARSSIVMAKLKWDSLFLR